MAKYTCIMLFISAFESETERIAEVNMFSHKGDKISLIDVNDFNKFPDAFPRFLYVGSYKNFDTNAFLVHLQEKVNWEYPQYMQAFIQNEEDYTIKVYIDGGKKLALDSFKETDG